MCPCECERPCVCVFAWCLCLQSNLVLMTVGHCPACNSDKQECVWMWLRVSACVHAPVYRCIWHLVRVQQVLRVSSSSGGLAWLWPAPCWFVNQSQVLKGRPKLWQWLPVSWNSRLPLSNHTWFQWRLLYHQASWRVMILGESVRLRLLKWDKMGHSVCLSFLLAHVDGISWQFKRLVSGCWTDSCNQYWQVV